MAAPAFSRDEPEELTLEDRQFAVAGAIALQKLGKEFIRFAKTIGSLQ